MNDETVHTLRAITIQASIWLGGLPLGLFLLDPQNPEMAIALLVLALALSLAAVKFADKIDELF